MTRKPVQSWNATTAIAQVLKNNYSNEAGSIDNNDAWCWIVQTLQRDPAMEAALEECREFLTDQMDVVDGSNGEPMPNRAMQLCSTINEAIRGR